jgi:alkanesulfonate monooxygenase SsuD/methylene tetrahydromethanopterin reductase-like flavin-dependent oxidoreductase (luciferase family)
MRFGTFHLLGSPDMAPAERRFDETIEQIALAEELGFDSVWVAEHHFSNYGYSANPLLLIAKASAVTSRVRFSQAVIVAPFYHPLRLAEDIAITDLLTHGRLEVGLGRGYQPMEFRGFNVSLADSRGMFEEQVELMRKAWTESDFTYSGRFYNLPDPITVLPKPLQQPHPPVWIACQSDTSLEWAATHDCNVLVSGSSASWKQVGAWAQRLVELRPPDQHPARLAMMRHTYVTPTEDEARAAAWQSRWQRTVAEVLRTDKQRITAGKNDVSGFEPSTSEEEAWERLIYGTPERCIEQVRRQSALGVTDTVLWFDIGGVSSDAVMRSMRLFAQEVMPAVKGIDAAVGV